MPDPSGSPVGVERRGCVRSRCLLGLPLRCVVKPSFHSAYGLLRDLSASGCGLLLEAAAPPPQGAVVLLQLSGGRPHDSYARLARVARAGPEDGSGCFVGCEFTPPLRDEELAAVRACLGL